MDSAAVLGKWCGLHHFPVLLCNTHLHHCYLVLLRANKVGREMAVASTDVIEIIKWWWHCFILPDSFAFLLMS
jgi:hypothetical protein